MVDSADLGFYGAAWRFTDFCQHLYARSVYLQLVLKSCELPGFFRTLHDLHFSRRWSSGGTRPLGALEKRCGFCRLLIK